jgi:hypothetical protein
MSVYSVKDVLHRVRIRLHRSNLPGAKGAYYAGAANEAVLSIEDVAATLKSRGGFTGNYHDLVSYVREFFKEMAYQLCDGYAVNTGWFLIKPVIGGLFESADEGFDPKKHTVAFRYRTGAPLRALAREVVVELEGANGSIDCFTDAESGTVNGTVTPGGFFTVSGRKIKAAEGPDGGLRFVSKAHHARRHKVEKALAENTATKVIGMVPALPAGEYFVEIKTCYTVGGKDMKDPRTIRSAFTVRAR